MSASVRSLLPENNQTMSSSPSSIYIPRLFANISAERIIGVFENLRLGKISYIDFVPRDQDPGTKMAFIYFQEWYTNNVACEHLIERINDHEREARIVYEDPYYWILLPNNSATTNVRSSFNNSISTDINNMQHTIHQVDRRVNEMSGVLDTLLADFYEIPQDNKVVARAQRCKVCMVEFDPTLSQCPSCGAPTNASQELLDILTSRPEDTAPEGVKLHAKMAQDAIKSFMNNQTETTNIQNNIDQPTETPPESSSVETGNQKSYWSIF